MRSIFRTVAVVLASLAVLAAPSFALSDAEYKRLMKDKNFARADKALSREWDRAKKLFPKTKEGQAAYKLLLDNQREWIKNGRDAEAKEIMENAGYSRTVAYAMATLSRSEEIPAIAQMYLEDAAPKTTPKKTSSKPKEITAPKPSKPREEAPKRESPKPRPRKEEPVTESGHRGAAGDWHGSYPDTGFCVGNSVRLREDPDTEAEIVGRLNEGDRVIVLGEASVDGEKWYSLDNPTQEGTAWAFGKYIDTYKGYETGTPVYNLYIQILLNFGITPEKAKVLLGDPDQELEDGPLDILEYPDLQLQYREKRLNRVEVWKSGLAFGGFQVGDPASKLNDALGEPLSKENGTWHYEGDPRTVLLFEVENDEITRMTWEELID